MSLLFSIALLLLAFASTFVGLHGKPVLEGESSWFRRTTARGWIMIGCLVLGVFIAISKEYYVQYQEKEKQGKVEERQRQLQETIKEAKHQAEVASLKQQLLATQIDGLRDRLKDEKSTLNDVQGALISTREQLSTETAANLTAILANANLAVRDIVLGIALNANEIRSRKLGEALFPRFSQQLCTDLTGMDVSIATGLNSVEEIHVDPNYQFDEIDFLTDTLPKVLGVGLSRRSAFVGRNSTANMLLVAILHTKGHSISAAELYSAMRKGANPLYISSAWPPVILKPESISKIVNRYYEKLDFLNPPVMSPTAEQQRSFRAVHPYPPACSNEMKRYFGSAFKSATITLVLDQPQSQIIRFGLHTLKPVLYHQEWYVQFVVDGQPIVGIEEPSFYAAIADAFPAEEIKPRTIK